MTHIASLRLTDFRNYLALDAQFEKSPVVFFGPNGAGKTNLLEAISFLSPGRGLRRAKVETLARRDNDLIAPAWGVTALLGDETRINIGQVPEFPKRRALRMDGASVTGTQLAKHLSLMWLTPAQDRLFTGPAGDRRKFIDRFALAHVPNHGAISAKYEKIRSERNRLLSEGVNDPLWYEALETNLSELGAHIAQARAITLTHLSEEIEARDSVFPKSMLKIEGAYENMFFDRRSLEYVQGQIKNDLGEGRALELRAGRTLIGPHRSDLHVLHIDKSMPASECSTGEQKALLIGLFLAQARAQKDRPPILLLDEVAAHLDKDRRAALIEELIDLNTQVFMTGTDASLFEAFQGRAQMFEVRQGKIINKNNEC